MSAGVLSSAASIALREEQPSRFLDLPPELRNMVYEEFTEHSDRTIILGHEAPTPTARSFFALTGVCKQLRAEFQPMLLHTYDTIQINAKDMFKCFETFNNQPIRPKLLHILVETQDVEGGFRGNMGLFFDFEFNAPRGYRSQITGTYFDNKGPHVLSSSPLFHALTRAKNMPRAFRADFKSGYISDVAFEYKLNGLQLWTLTISMDNTKMEKPRLENIRRYCMRFCPRSDHSKKMVSIKVSNKEDGIFEEYMWVATQCLSRGKHEKIIVDYRLWHKIGEEDWKSPGIPAKPVFWDW